MSPSDRNAERKPRPARLDRRTSRRLTIAPGHMTLEATVHGQRIVGRVIDVSEGGLKVLFASDAARPKLGSTAEHAVLTTTDDGPIPLARLVTRGAVNEPAGLVITMATEDETTRASLWYLMQQLSSTRAPIDDTDGEVEELPRIPMRGHYHEAARLSRLEWVRGQTGARLEALQAVRLEPTRLTGNIENMIGAIEVPVGIAGPLVFHGQAAKGTIVAPLATTEGALVASMTRGATAISQSGGVTTRVLGQRMMRMPLFCMSSLEGAVLLAAWLRDHVHELREKVREVSRHAELVSIEAVIMGRSVHVQFLYETADAAGQNMTTVCTWHACQWLIQQMRFFPEAHVEHFYIDGNTSGDKKVTYRSFINGRGIRVVAECVLRRDVLERVLKVTPEMVMASYGRSLAGAVTTGMIGFNVNVANTIAAMFTATGQDIACVHESSLAQLHFEAVPEGIYASIVLPGLIVGTVGGGTHLPGQHDLLEMLGCAGPRKVFRLAEIIAGFALALDLSTYAAVSNGEFAAAHDRLGRNRPVHYLERRDFGPGFFEAPLRAALGQPELRVRAVDPLDTTLGSSIVTELTGRKVNKLVGLFPLRLAHDTPGATQLGQTDVILKVKPLDEEVYFMGQTMAAMCGPRLAMAFQRHGKRTGTAGCHVRELAIYEQTDERFVAHVPKVFRTWRDDSREAYVLVLEHLADLRLMDSADNPRGWSRRYIEAALQGLGQIHAVWLGRERELLAQPWIGTPPDARSMVEMAELWDALAVHGAQEFPELVNQPALDRLRRYIATLGDWWPKLEAMPRTLVHNDFNPRNVALRDDKTLRLCAYDWELATLHVPQHDLAEFLCFTLPPEVQKRNVDYLVEAHRKALEQASGRPLDKARWREGYALALRDLAINRFGLYLMAHTFRYYGFMERTMKTLWRLLDLEEGAA
jgi:NADP-dependent 3-hydroxy-3-methylglutaryl-CoA reductase